MSLEIVLIPLAMAAISAAAAKKAGTDPGRSEVQVTSRLKHGGIVAAALGDLGASVQSAQPESIRATLAERPFSLDRGPDGLWVGTFGEGWAEADAMSLVQSLDAAYGVRVQQEVVRKIHERAPAAGMSIESQRVEDDRTVTLLLTVEAGA